MGPARKIGNISAFFGFCRPTQKIGPDGPKWGQEDFFLLIQTLPTFWAERILILRVSIFSICPAHAKKGLKGSQMGPGGFFRTNPDPADILGDMDFDFENFYLLDVLDPKFPDVQVPDLQISRNLAWA